MRFNPKTCPNLNCKAKGVFHRKGFFKVSRANSTYRRFQCTACKKTFSFRTFQPDYRQKKKDLNPLLTELILNGYSLRAAARTIKMTYKNTYKKFLWLSAQAQLKRQKLRFKATKIFFDEMETIEHTKCKPLSILLLVNENYEILEAKVAKMPAKGKLAKFSVQKYGKRRDERNSAIKNAFSEIKRNLKTSPHTLLSDAKPNYGLMVSKFFPKSQHLIYSRKNKERYRDRLHEKGQKKLYDPMFVINQRCAKLRADIRRLTRRSWCTTKKPENLQCHLDLYIANQFKS